MPNITRNDSQRNRLPLSSIAMLVGVLALTLLFAGRELLPAGSSDSSSAELHTLVGAVQAYRADHGFYPGSRDDFGYPLSDARLREKLLQPTDATGQTNDLATRRFRYGPYLDSFPADPLHGVQALRWVLGDDAATEERLKSLASSEGGWIYAPESGIIQANLGGS